ncbi:hypothetical protein [Longitalea arenae]|nr:hypothetical protein [Longitalea arenae]
MAALTGSPYGYWRNLVRHPIGRIGTDNSVLAGNIWLVSPAAALYASVRP